MDALPRGWGPTELFSVLKSLHCCLYLSSLKLLVRVLIKITPHLVFIMLLSKPIRSHWFYVNVFHLFVVIMYTDNFYEFCGILTLVLYSKYGFDF